MHLQVPHNKITYAESVVVCHKEKQNGIYFSFLIDKFHNSLLGDEFMKSLLTETQKWLMKIMFGMGERTNRLFLSTNFIIMRIEIVM